MLLCDSGASLGSWVLEKANLTPHMAFVLAWMKILLLQTLTIIVYKCLRKQESSNISLEYQVKQSNYIEKAKQTNF